jgi:hypothetical protein
MTLVDTSSWIQYLRRDGEAEMKEKVRSLLLDGAAVLCPVVNGKWVDLINKEELSSKDRGDNGFGSTGIF